MDRKPESIESVKGYDEIPDADMELISGGSPLPAPILPPKRMQRDDLEEGDTSVKCCRICLEEDDPDSMIAPCLCKGSQKWVHTSCLDLWRQNEPDRAFGRCTECQFAYHFQEERSHSVFWRRTKFCLFVSRDLCCVNVLLQLVIGFLGWITFLIDMDRTLPQLLDGSATCTENDSRLWCNHKMTVYYMFGFFELFVLMGLVGSIFFCSNGCKIPDLSNTNNNDTELSPSRDRLLDPNSDPGYEAQRRASYYRRRRYRNGNCCPHHGYYFYDGSCCDGCCLCLDCASCCDRSNNCCGNCHTGSGSSSSSDDCSHVLIIILLVVVVVMAVVGFFVGLFLAVVVIQRVVQNHLFRLQKKQLVEEFRVKDMSSYRNEVEQGSIYEAPPLMPPKIHPDDEAHLKKLGLLTDE